MVIFFAYQEIDRYFREKAGKIDSLVERLNRIEQRIDYMQEIHRLDKRVSLLEEGKAKKGQVDPKIIMLIVLLFLLYLYLRSIGFLK